MLLFIYRITNILCSYERRDNNKVDNKTKAKAKKRTPQTPPPWLFLILILLYLEQEIVYLIVFFDIKSLSTNHVSTGKV
jgi:hypothetical protein